MYLAVDTSIGSTVAVVGRDGAVLAEAESVSPRGHAEVIGDLLTDAIARAGVTPDEVTHVVAGMGPGPFTGLRIGIAAARAFALGRGIPVTGVVSHDAIALGLVEGDTGVAEVAGRAGGFVVLTDARRRENAVSVFGASSPSGGVRRLAGPELRPDDADLSDDPLLAPLPAIGHRDDAPAGHGLEREASGRLVHLASRVPAGALGRIAALGLHDGSVDEPLYLRSPDVTVNHTRKRVST